jgi:hypothetical protein
MPVHFGQARQPIFATPFDLHRSIWHWRTTCMSHRCNAAGVVMASTVRVRIGCYRNPVDTEKNCLKNLIYLDGMGS